MEPTTSNTIEIVHQGILDYTKKQSLIGLKWKNRYVRLVNGGIYIYNNEKDPKYKLLDIEFAVLIPTSEGITRPNSFSIRDANNKLVYFSCNTTSDHQKWCELVKKCIGQKNAGEPQFDQTVVKREGRNDVLFRAKKNISGKIASSGVGKSGLKKLIPEEGRELINGFKKIVKRTTNDDKANEMEKNLIKILVKVFFQLDNKSVQVQDVVGIDKHLRDGFNLLDKAFRFYGVKRGSELSPILEKAANALKEAENETCKVFAPYLRPHNLQKIRNTYALLASQDFLVKVWDDPEIEDELFLLISALNKYTQIELSY
ncbi:hypothetical protein DLAC_11476 [Tieghemostelium lacteum]|uniref:PH domain-containing protein n=1 Tax=Tieghemostelium lacteum TaxID=361077 RepID=A0A152A8H0_TIELA|nr:hypothetical protein DLAC_11476 [Tieghemostelium lacteum]|eukprot:KYR02516.1 hypothetical protein DLAC_11476 [Tieghemostelium lacteum]